ncbi:DUF6777 domain-containing protein [Streptomyces sp. NPDC055749]
MRSPQRPRRTALAALSFGVLLVTGCAQDGGSGENGTKGTAGGKELLLQPAAEPGPDPFSGSSAGSPPPAATASPAALAGVRARTVSGSTPGLYGGTRSEASCDVEEQLRFLTADRAKGRAFAEAAGIRQKEIPAFLRGLTPVLLRSDIRVTGHGYAEGSPTAFQSVLQAGTAVLADTHGSPRVRCACGNPLGSPVVMKGTMEYRGKEWAGYDPNRVLVIEASMLAITDFVIADVDDGTWIERPAGDDGAQDRTPDDPPPFDPGDGIVSSPDASTPPPASDPATPAPPSETSGPDPSVPQDVPTDEPADEGVDAPLEEVVEVPADESYATPPDPVGDSAGSGDSGEEPAGPGQYPDGAVPPMPDGPDVPESFAG